MGVDNAARTRDLLNHNQMLYRLSYIHHGATNDFAQQVDTIHVFCQVCDTARRITQYRTYSTISVACRSLYQVLVNTTQHWDSAHR